MIRVLVAEDSAVSRQVLVHLLTADPALQVVGTATDGVEAIEAAQRFKPDVITMDVNMPRLNGFEATRRIMETNPVPIIIVSGSWAPGEVATSFRAVEVGALAMLPRPPGPSHPDHAAQAHDLIQTIKLMAEVKVVRRWTRERMSLGAPLAKPATSLPGSKPGTGQLTPPASSVLSTAGRFKLVAMGASTGGPLVLQTILRGLPADFAAPVVIVQHIASGFVQGFADWLTQTCQRPVRLAEDHQVLEAGQVYVAPDSKQMRVIPGGRVMLTDDPPENGLRPAVSYLFRSVASVYGAGAVGVLLTGMGRDGADALKLMRDSGAVTLVQDEASSVVHGMPGEAIRLEAADYVLAPEGIQQALITLVGRR